MSAGTATQLGLPAPQDDIRRLSVDDLADVVELAAFDGLGDADVRRELSCAGGYVYVGLRGPGGQVVALHRAMVWGDQLLLKGVVVRPGATDSGAPLRLAFWLRDEARRRGLTGVCAWVEPRRPEAALAQRLRLRPRGVLVHRYEVRWGDGEGEPSAPYTGTIDVPGEHLLPDLLDSSPGDEVTTSRIRWVIDGRRLVLSGWPGPTVADLVEVLAELVPASVAAAVSSVEAPLPAADLAAAFGIAATGGRRLSRTPVLLSQLDLTAQALA